MTGMIPLQCAPRVLVVDDDPAIGELCQMLLEESGCTVDTATHGDAALACLGRKVYHLVILDLIMPEMNGYELLAEIRERFKPGPPVCILTSYASLDSCLQCAQLGIAGYLSKPVQMDDFLLRVHSFLAERPPSRRASDFAAREVLTEREKQILVCLRQGLTDADIARQLFISPLTVHTHVKHITEKLNVRNRSEAVALSYREDVFGMA
jgi:DNA-binding NarL/FixJ family response regulator